MSIQEARIVTKRMKRKRRKNSKEKNLKRSELLYSRSLGNKGQVVAIGELSRERYHPRGKREG